MTSLKELKKQIENANALGVANLTDKGIKISADATTYGIMQSITDIITGGSSVEYASIVYNDDNTVTLTDKDGVEHTMVCTYDNDKLVGITYDDKAVSLTYDNDKLVKVGDTTVDVSNAQVSGGTEELEQLIDESGVLEDTEGTVTEKVEWLIGKANDIKAFEGIISARTLFKSIKNFPSKSTINLPYVTDVYQAFSYWNSTTEPIPIVEELTVNALSINVSNNQTCMGQMFVYNNGVKKLVLKMPNESQYMVSTFSNASNLEEVVLNFSTKNIEDYNRAFNMCSKLKKIVGALDFSVATNVGYMFFYCTNLEEVSFEPNTLSLSMLLNSSSKLTSESVQSIIDGLATVTTAQTLTLHSAIVLTDEQKATIKAKGWTLVQ